MENNEVIVLEIKFNYMGKEEKIYPVVLNDKNNMILVDCGYEGFLPLIEKEMQKHGLNPNNLNYLYLTHQDDDHMGSAYEIKKKYPNIKIITSKIEKDYISGKKKNIRLEQGENLLKFLEGDEKKFGEQFCERMRNIKNVTPNIEVEDGEVFDWVGGCEVIDTRGHTSGHTSLYLKKYKYLIVGDAGVLENNTLVVANPQYSYNLEQAKNSLKKIKSMDIKKYICYHGGVKSL